VTRPAERALGLSLLGLALIGAGCGGSDEAQIEETVKRFYRASAEGDGRKACDQLTRGAQAPVGDLGCEAAIGQLGALGGDRSKRRLSAVQVRRVNVTGDTATAVVQIPSQTPAEFQFEKVSESSLRWRRSEGEWRVASLGSSPGGTF